MGVTGSVAAYRAADICRELMRQGFTVRACLSRSAEQFVTRGLFEALTGGPVLTEVFDEPVRGSMAHIDWAREASCILLCPASANAIAVLAEGKAEDMFSTIVSASTAPLVVAPAMNPEMYASIANQENLARLAKRGAIIVEPAEGDVACGENGQGKLASIERIVEAVQIAGFRSQALEGKRVVITSGPTREPIDPVRFLSNRSSGKMGFALARAALQMGAGVTVVSGPTAEIPPPKAVVARVETAQQMLEAAMAACEGADLFIGAAAVADFRPAEASGQKMKGKEPFPLQMVPNADIITSLRAQFPKLVMVGFAAETNDHEANAAGKLEAKGLQAIVLNDVSRSDAGFDAETNAGSMLFVGGKRLDIALDSKFNVARAILEAAAKLL